MKEMTMGVGLRILFMIGCLQYSEQRSDSHSRQLLYNGHPYHRSWTSWSSWSHCSRTCGGGIIMRTRLCRRRIDVVSRNSNRLCPGETTEYKICNRQDCPSDSIDFRQIQCSAYNNRYIAQEYIKEWIPYNKGWNKCELKCQARSGERHYSFGKVSDGTKCADDKHVCVNGRCLPVGCDGKVGSDSRTDVCGICGGRNTTCVYYRNVYLGQLTTPGYQEVITIPSGATHVEIKDVSYNNVLALTDSKYQYIINKPGSVSYSGQYHVMGTIINYNRLAENKEIINIVGPTNENLYVLALLRDKNPGIYYQYWLPKDKYFNIGTVIPKHQQPSYNLIDGNPPTYRGWDPTHNAYNFEIYKYKNKNEESQTKETERPHKNILGYHRYQVDNLHTRQWNDVSIKIVDKSGEGIPLTNGYSSTADPVSVSTDSMSVNSSATESCSVCRRVKNLPRHFCKSHFVLRATVIEKKRAEGKIRYEIQITSSYKNNIALQPKEYLWTRNKCRCPKLRLGREYIIMGYTEHIKRESRLVINKKCYVRRYNQKKSKILLKMKHESCSKTSV